jgi:prepilin-type N-terminal cleavage/methylation domain-containing protein
MLSERVTMARSKEKFLRTSCEREGERIVKSMAKSRKISALQSGFTLVEVIVVVTLVLVVSGLSVPNLTRAIDTSQLKGAAQTLAAAYQDARIRATQQDTSYAVLVSPLGIMPAQLCIDLDGDGTCSAGDPVTTFPSQVTVSNLGVPFKLGPAQLTYQTTDTEHSSAPGNGLIWNALGLPCQVNTGTQCTAVGWVQHLQLQRSNGEVMYAAVSVSPTGRVKTWIFIPSSNGNGQWL